jgi:ABC-type branched-subunit amino acid transport system ATPase component
VAATELFDELELVVATELFDELVAGVELELGTELATELFELEDVVATELLVAVEHTVPVITGFSAAAVLFLSPCTPKLTDWPGAMVLFQSKAVAE